MDRLAEKQAQIDLRRQDLIARYPHLWKNIISELNQASAEDRIWLTYSANYLLRTAGVRWAIDPLTLQWRLKHAAPQVYTPDLENLAFVLLTHSHADHLDLDLLSALRHLAITWVVPEHILDSVIRAAKIKPENILVPLLLQPFELNGIRITAFDGLHWEQTPEGIRRGVPATGYLAEWSGKRWLFPGDTRAYEPSLLPRFGAVDGLAAHLWMGRGAALLERPPLLTEFCRFCLALQPARILLTHLQEYGRNAEDFWDETHLQMVFAKFREMTDDVIPQPVLIGGGISI